MKNNKKNILIIFVLSIIVFYLLLKDDFIEKIVYIFSFNIWWLLFALLLVIGYILCRSISLNKCTKHFNNNHKLSKSIKMILDTQLINGITPFSVGGQPYQIYKLKKQGYKVEEGTNIVIQDFIVYQIALVFLGTIAVIINHYLGIFEKNIILRNLVLLGYLINLAVIIGLFIVSFNKKGNTFILDKIFKIGSKLKIIKIKEETIAKRDEYIANFNESAKTLLKNKLDFLFIIITNIIGLCLLYLVPFALINGLGETINPLIAIISTAYVMLLGSFVPTPGASGGIEFGFNSFYASFIPGIKLASILIVWRILTYYLGLFVGIITITKEDN